MIDLFYESVVELAGRSHHTPPRLHAIAALNFVQQGGIGIEGILRPDLGARQLAAPDERLAGDVTNPEIVVVDQIGDDAVEQVVAKI